LAELSAAERESILCGTAAAFYGISADRLHGSPT